MTVFIGIVCGLKSEAAVVRAVIDRLQTDRFRIGVSGANADRAAAIATGFAREGARGLLSIGVSGGLDPRVRPGSVIVSDRIISSSSLSSLAPAGEVSPTAAEGVTVADLNRRQEPPSTASPRPFGSHPERTPPDRDGGRKEGGLGPLIYGADVIIQSAEEKRRLYAATKAVAVDMESHGVARAAVAARLPFLAIRAIADPAERALPTAALGAIAPDGSTRIIRTLLYCAKAPGDFPHLLKLGADQSAALSALRRDLGPLLRDFLFRLDL